MGEYNFNHIYFIGIGGIGMSGIAEILLDLGYQISGSDIKNSAVVERLQQKGAKIYIGQKAENITGDIDLVVRSTAIRENNQELQQAIEMNIPIMHRSQMLAMLMLDKQAICVAGAHGKTTTSSMIALMLEKAQKDPTIVVGGEIAQIGSNAKCGSSDLLVAEADESDGSFVHLYPWMTVVTNIEEDHLDHYENIDAIREVFIEFVQKAGEDGVAVLNVDCAETRKLIDLAPGKVITYGFSSDAEIRAAEWWQEGQDTYGKIYRGEEYLGEVHLRVPGQHNISNALAAIAAGLELGLEFAEITAGLLEFTGARRRFQLVGEVNGVKIIDDYAHHPTEVEATIKTAREVHDGRLFVVFQPHRYSRTMFFAEKFAASFALADKIVLTEVYSAGEHLEEGAESTAILEKIAPELDSELILREKLNEYLVQEVQPGDLVLMMGAGNICQNSAQLVEDLKHHAN